MNNIELITKNIDDLKIISENLSNKIIDLEKDLQILVAQTSEVANTANSAIFSLTIFLLSSIVGYYIVWRVTPALHTPLMTVTNAISGIIIIGAMIAAGSANFNFSNIMGLIATILASINNIGGFFVAYRMLSMFRKKS